MGYGKKGWRERVNFLRQQKAPDEPGLFAANLAVSYSLTMLTNVCCSTPFLRYCTLPFTFANNV